MNRKYQQCTRCVMDTSDPDIVFDKNGYCNHCKDYKWKLAHLTYQGESSDEQFEKVIDEIKNRAGKEDTIV